MELPCPTLPLSSVNVHFWFYFHRLKAVGALQILLALCPEKNTVGPKAGNSEYCFQPERTNWKGSIHILSPAYSRLSVQTQSVYDKTVQIWNKIPIKYLYHYGVILCAYSLLSKTGKVPFVGLTDTKFIQPRTTSFTQPILVTLQSSKAPVSDSEFTQLHFTTVTTLAANF